ncbi:MAG: hypothetical protein AAB316_20910, partial [Bacteroidota bacterium]
CRQETPPSAPEVAPASDGQTRAKNGDEVWIIVTYVKDEIKSDFEKWVKDVLYAALYKTTNPMKKDQLKVTRWLEPTQQNEDKTWTYVWIMDPVIPNTNYDIPTFLNQEYGEEKGKEHWATYQTFWAKPVEAHVLKQSSL